MAGSQKKVVLRSIRSTTARSISPSQLLGQLKVLTDLPALSCNLQKFSFYLDIAGQSNLSRTDSNVDRLHPSAPGHDTFPVSKIILSVIASTQHSHSIELETRHYNVIQHVQQQQQVIRQIRLSEDCYKRISYSPYTNTKWLCDLKGE